MKIESSWQVWIGQTNEHISITWGPFGAKIQLKLCRMKVTARDDLMPAPVWDGGPLACHRNKARVRGGIKIVSIKISPVTTERGSDPASPSDIMEEPGMKTICGCKFCFVSLLCIWHDITSFHPSLSCPDDVPTTKKHVELQVAVHSKGFWNKG